MIVVDASAIGTFLIPDEAVPFADFALATCTSEALYAPALLPAELASLIRKAQRRGRLQGTDARAAAHIADSITASITIEALPPVAELTANSEALGLTVYDAAYFLLARKLDSPLLTEDKRLRDTAIEHGIAVLMP